jgi:hypothetical protein
LGRKLITEQHTYISIARIIKTKVERITAIICADTNVNSGSTSPCIAICPQCDTIIITKVDINTAASTTCINVPISIDIYANTTEVDICTTASLS